MKPLTEKEKQEVRLRMGIARMTAARRGWELPASTHLVAGKHGFATGLYLMYGSRASSKTLSSLGLADELSNSGANCIWGSVMEPRAKHVLDAISVGEDESVDQLRGWQSILERWLIAAGSKGYVFADSLTYVLTRLDAFASEEFTRQLGTQTYKEGLTPQIIVACLLTDAMAREHNVCLIGTLNSELFPFVDKLEGATEGRIQIMAPGRLIVRDRSTRKDRPIDVDPKSMNTALDILGYPGPFRQDTPGLDLDLDMVIL